MERDCLQKYKTPTQWVRKTSMTIPYSVEFLLEISTDISTENGTPELSHIIDSFPSFRHQISEHSSLCCF